MGSGKSTVGRLLAERTGWPLTDNDQVVRQLFGMTPREILAEHGEARLRASESAALAAALEIPPPSIVGAAAGTILDPANRERLADSRTGLVVWLQATPKSLAARSMGAEHRPWLDTGGAAWIEEASVQREPLFGSVADLVVETDDRSAEAVADEILAKIRGEAEAP